MDSKGSRDEEFDLPDPTDWLSTPLPSLSAVDAAVRCQVCKDLYTTPMITSCSHTFCSLCIRRSLIHDGKCPACRAGDQETKLRQNWAMEEMVEAFKKARPEVMEFAKRPAARIVSPKRKHEDLDAGRTPALKRTRSGRAIQSAAPVAVPDDLDEKDEDYTPDEEARDGLVECPICQDRMTVKAVQAHLDDCGRQPPSKKKVNTHLKPLLSPQRPIALPERLPHPHYSSIRDAALRKKLVDLRISSSGPRQLMEQRYTEWITRWNANCDSKKPKGQSDLRRELDVWERTLGGKAPIAKREQASTQIRNKDFDGKAWAERNDDSYRVLIAKAREKPNVNPTIPETPIAQSEIVDGPTPQSSSSFPLPYSRISATPPDKYNGQRDPFLQEPPRRHTTPPPRNEPAPTLEDRDAVASSELGTIKPLQS